MVDDRYNFAGGLIFTHNQCHVSVGLVSPKEGGRLSVHWPRDDGSKPVLRSQAPPKGPIGPLLTFTLEWTAPSETSVWSILKIKDPIATTAETQKELRLAHPRQRPGSTGPGAKPDQRAARAG
jgi:hypothetical protein